MRLMCVLGWAGVLALATSADAQTQPPVRTPTQPQVQPGQARAVQTNVYLPPMLFGHRVRLVLVLAALWVEGRHRREKRNFSLGNGQPT